MQHIVPVVMDALNKAGCKLEDVDAFAFTQAPGLIGALLIGAQFSKSLSLAYNKPLIAVNHMQAHVLANLIDEPAPAFPYLCLTVSGGHTQIVLCRAPTDLQVIGQTIDDAAGEAFDKSAKLLGLPYPGGPLIDFHAAKGNSKAFQFPEPKIEGLDFSFSGVKTSILYFLQNAGKSNVYNESNAVTDEERRKFIDENLADICASIQERLVSILLNKLKKAVKQTGIKHVCIAGGVSANRGLRAEFMKMGKELNWATYIPKFEYCTDNAAMIAITGYHKYLRKDFAPLDMAPMARAEW